MVGHQGDHVTLLAEHVLDEAAQGALRADFDEDPRAGGVHRLQPLHPLHRRGDLLLQQVFDLGHAGRVELAGDVGHQRQARRGDVHAVEHLAQRRAGRGDNAGVEGVADRQLHRLVAALLEQLDGLLDGLALAADDRLGVAIDVGRDDVAADLMQRGLDDLVGGQNGGHPAVVVHLDPRHLAPTAGGGFQRFGEGQDAGGHQRAVLAQRVAHDHVGGEAVVGQQPADGLVQRQHGRLGDLRLHQVEVGLIDGRFVVAVNEQIAAQRAAENGLHDGVGLVQRGLDRGREGGQLAPHVDVLAALAGEEEGQLARLRAVAAEDALRFHRFPRLWRVEAHDLARLL